MARKAQKHGGGRLGRSETVTIRLDPKLNYLAEIAARAQRRTKSSLLEAALADALFAVKTNPADGNSRSVAQIGEDIWHVDEWERLRRLAAYAPYLMTYEEQKIWAVISKNSNFWFGSWEELDAGTEYYSYKANPENLCTYTLEKHWELVKKVAAGEAKPEELPFSQMFRAKPHQARELGTPVLGALERTK